MEASMMLMLMLGVGQIDEPGPPQPPVVVPPPLPPVPPVQPPPVPPRPTLPPSECPSFCQGLNDSMPAICDMCKGETLTDACALVRCQAGYVCVARSTKGVCEPVRHLQCGAESCQSGFKCEMDGQTPSPIKYSCAAEAHGCFAKDGTLFTDKYLDKSTAVGQQAGTLWKCRRFQTANGTFLYTTISHDCTMRNSLGRLVIVGSAAVEVDGSYFRCRTHYSDGDRTYFITPANKPPTDTDSSSTENCTDASGTEHKLYDIWAENGVMFQCMKEGPAHLVCPLSRAIGCAINETKNGRTTTERLKADSCQEQRGTNGSNEYQCCEYWADGRSNGYRLHQTKGPSCVMDGKVIPLKSNYTKAHKAGMKLFHPLDRGVWYSCYNSGNGQYRLQQHGCAAITDENRVRIDDLVTIKDQQFVCYNRPVANSSSYQYQLLFLPILENDCVNGSGAYFRDSATVDDVSVVCHLRRVFDKNTVIGIQLYMVARGAANSGSLDHKYVQGAPPSGMRLYVQEWQRARPYGRIYGCVYTTLDGLSRRVKINDLPRTFDGRLLSCVGDANNISSVQLIEHEAMDSSTHSSAAATDRNGCVDSASVRRANYEEWQDRVLPHGAIQYRCYHGSIRSRGCTVFPDGAASNRSYFVSNGNYYSLTSLTVVYISADTGFLVVQNGKNQQNLSYTHEPACYYNGQRYLVGEHRITHEADSGPQKSVEVIECTVRQMRLRLLADVEEYTMQISHIGCLGPDGQVWPNGRSAEVNGKGYKCMNLGSPKFRIIPYQGSYGCEDSQGNVHLDHEYFYDDTFSYLCKEIISVGSANKYYVKAIAEMISCFIGPDKVEISMTSSLNNHKPRDRSKQVCVGGEIFVCYRDDDNKLHLEKLL